MFTSVHEDTQGIPSCLLFHVALILTGLGMAAYLEKAKKRAERAQAALGNAASAESQETQPGDPLGPYQTIQF